MSKTSIATLKERLSDCWVDWDMAAYQIGACLGFWGEFGAPIGFDQWHGTKQVMWSNNPLGSAISLFLDALVDAGCLERKDEPITMFRWNDKYQIKVEIEE